MQFLGCYAEILKENDIFVWRQGRAKKLHGKRCQYSKMVAKGQFFGDS
jgi:hypothetical protein